MIQKEGIAGFKSNEIGVIETDDFLRSYFDSDIGINKKIMINKRQVEISSRDHRLVIVAGAHVPDFFRKSSAPLPDARVYLETDIWKARMRVLLGNTENLSNFLQTNR